MKTFLKGFSVAAVLMLVMCTSLLSGCVNIIFPERQIKTNKAKYYTNEEILITAKGDENCRVGVYRVTDDVYNVEAIRQYWVNREGFISGNTYSLQRAGKLSETFQPVLIMQFYSMEKITLKKWHHLLLLKILCKFHLPQQK